ncbi:glucosidase 2 subunit beta-like [Mustelus asterias]
MPPPLPVALQAKWYETSRFLHELPCLIPSGFFRWTVEMNEGGENGVDGGERKMLEAVSSCLDLGSDLERTAEKARNTFSEAEKSLKEVESLIGNIEKELTIDFGTDGEFAYMFNQCYEMTTNEYIYKLCPFNKVAQKPKHGGSETSLGIWGSWAGPEHSRFSAMKYEHGTGCWQGPSRSTLVKLSCGKETAVLSTSEPSRCEYLMEFSTPAFCQEESYGEGTDHDEL